LPIVQTQVLVAGAGPCGLMLANELGRRGISCLVVDAKPGTAFNPQANATQARTMEHFRRLGFASEIRAQGLPAHHPTDIAYLTRFAGIELARLRLPTAADAPQHIKTLSGSWSAAELPHRVSQKYVEATLRRHAEQWPSVDLRFGWQLRNFDDTGDNIEATIAPVGQSSPVRIQAAYLIGADGARSGVRKQLGIAWEGETGFKRQFMGGTMLAVYLRAPGFYQHNPNDRAWMYVAVNPQMRGFIMSVDGVAEFAFHVQMTDDAATQALTEDDARALFCQAYGQPLPLEILSMATWLAGHALVAATFQSGRVFLAGDAAHLFTPTGGLGYNTAVEDAVNLGWKLASVLKGQAPAALLSSYESERKPLALRNTRYAREFADSIGLFVAAPELEADTPDGLQARAAASDYLNAHARREFNIPGVTLGGRYDASPVIVSDGSTAPPDQANAYEPSACPGGRPPHAWLPDGRSLYDTFNFEWTLLALGHPAPITHAFEDTALARHLDLKVVHVESAELQALYQAALVLIRPDQIVAWRGSDGRDAEQVIATAIGCQISQAPAPQT
jgi:2-polyprenyl-6-methoxyphenol hydroxylase-like FAD-dependent oxidoreductase